MTHRRRQRVRGQARHELARWDCTRRCTQPPRMSRQIVRQPAADELSRFLAQLMSRQCLQFSIRSLFVATLLCAVSVYLWPWRPKPSVHQSIRTILQRDTSNDEKLNALAGYVRVGDTADQIRSRLGDWCDCEGHGVGCFLYTFDESGLVIAFHQDGVSYGIGYYPPPGADGVSRLQWLQTPEVVVWPSGPLINVREPGN